MIFSVVHASIVRAVDVAVVVQFTQVYTTLSKDTALGVAVAPGFVFAG
jgi:hypothetical protein